MFKAIINPKTGFLVAYVMLFINISYKGYFLGDTTFLLGLCVLIYVLRLNSPGAASTRFFIPTLLLAITSFFVPTFSIRYLLLVLALLFCLESMFRKLNGLAFITLLLMSPLFRYASETFTFPIRIWLSEISGQILTIMHFPVEVAGNTIILNGNNFLVDAACTGLQMLGFSFLFSVFLLAYYQDTHQKKIGFGWQLLALLITFLLNIISNLCRILLLIIFRIAPENPLHDLIGICCLIVYVWLPMAWLVKQTVLRLNNNTPVTIKADKTSISQWVFNSLSLILTTYLVLSFSGTGKSPDITITKEKTNYNTKVLQNGITQLKNNHALVYLKPIPDFYSGEHNPVFCWKGSGYTSNKVKEEVVQNYSIYTGILNNKNDVLYTAWWFSNGEIITNSQLEWRWRVLKGESKFELINVTASSEHELKKAIAEWL